MAMQLVNFYIEPEIRKELNEYCELTGRKLSTLLRSLIKKELSKK